jgi:hypothetical protein
MKKNLRIEDSLLKINILKLSNFDFGTWVVEYLSPPMSSATVNCGFRNFHQNFCDNLLSRVVHWDFKALRSQVFSEPHLTDIPKSFDAIKFR